MSDDFTEYRDREGILSEEEIKKYSAETKELIKQWKAAGLKGEDLTDEQCRQMFIDPELVPELGKFMYWRGMKIPTCDWLNYGYVPVSRILHERNMEERRALIGMLGVNEFLRKGGAEDVTKEDERGYKIVKMPIEGAGAENWYYLKMINSTIEPGTHAQARQGIIDGGVNDQGYKIYFLKLPSSLIHKKITNEEAVAWSFKSRVAPGAVYKNGTQKFLDASQQADYDFNGDKRTFVNQARQGDVFIRKLANSLEDLKKGKLYTGENGEYDPWAYAPEVES